MREPPERGAERGGVILESREVLREKARSFRWAARFLAPETHDDAALLYAFCRYVDDIADAPGPPEHARRDLDAIERDLEAGGSSDPMLDAFLKMSHRRALDLEAAAELVRGVRSDLVGEVRLGTDVELIRYCYRVAGTVGLMMCSVLGVEHDDAKPFAVDLGVGMQLTNICRDVAEDAAMGRVYLPTPRLERAGVRAEEIVDGRADREAVARVVRDLLAVADRYYASAESGMRFIPARSRLAILIASRIYRSIGTKLRRQGADALAGRTVVRWPGKTGGVARAVGRFVRPSVPRQARALPAHDGRLHRAIAGLPGASA